MKVLGFEISCKVEVRAQRIINQLMRGAVRGHYVVEFCIPKSISNDGKRGDGSGANTVPELLFAFKSVL